MKLNEKLNHRSFKVILEFLNAYILYIVKYS